MKKLIIPHRNHSQAGFTIVELMIATVIFSMVLVVITVGVLHFTNSYYKGVNGSSTQTTAQNALDIITQSIEFGNVSSVTQAATIKSAYSTYTNTTDEYFCAGSNLFYFSPGVKYTGGTPAIGNWGLYQLPAPNNCAVSASMSTSGGTELLGENMRVAWLTLALPSASGTPPAQALLKVAYGDNDLLCRTSLGSGTGGCTGAPYGGSASIWGSDVTCHLASGSQFCYVATLQSAVTPRVGTTTE